MRVSFNNLLGIYKSTPQPSGRAVFLDNHGCHFQRTSADRVGSTRLVPYRIRTTPV